MVAAVIRVPVSRRVVRVQVGEPIVRAIVPVATQTDSTHDGRIDKVGIASQVPFDFEDCIQYEGCAPLPLRGIHPPLINEKVAAVKRGPVSRRVVRVQVGEPIGRARVPAATQTDSTHDGRKDKGGIIRVVRA